MISKEQINIELRSVLEESVINEWWDTPIFQWDGVTPNEMLPLDPKKVIGLVLSYLNPSWG